MSVRKFRLPSEILHGKMKYFVKLVFCIICSTGLETNNSVIGKVKTRNIRGVANLVNSGIWGSETCDHHKASLNFEIHHGLHRKPLNLK